ncbi:MAG TPA: UDP-N-acetylmuramate--L-alanine ligase [Flavobacteriales bacterium]|nr:UDP-N-acetylmuramate--L-alanine ligase [Flavobacteriales bacterium]
MNLDLYKHIYLLGIGGIGMSALAKYFNAQGIQVSGYDKSKTTLTEKLEKEGIAIHYKDDISQISDEVKVAKFAEILVIYTPAIDENNTEFHFFKEKGIIPLKRSEVLGIITRQSFTIAIAGTHGKTTTAALLTHILKNSEIDCTAFLGGVSKDFNSNLILAEKGNIVIVEADEYDRSFLSLYPDVAVITSIDEDHLDIYENKKSLEIAFQKFASQVKQKGFLLVQAGVQTEFEKPEEGALVSYSATEKADYYASNIGISNNKTKFDIGVLDILPEMAYEKKITNLLIDMPGKHNIENVLAASAVACFLGATCDNVEKAIGSFKGIKRRFEIHLHNDKMTFIDDYAHHPKEVKVTIQAVKELYEGKKVMVIFQPHLFSRTQDFADEFAESLSLSDELILLEIYPAREKPIDGVTSQMLAEKCTIKNEVCSKEQLLSVLEKKDFEVLLTMGAGDISTLVQPIKEFYN